MPKTIVKVKQCTPLLQFQAEQKGAGLRGTEMKPLLDRCLKRKFGYEQLRNYQLPNDDPSICAYDYRLVIEPMIDASVVINPPNPTAIGIPCFQLKSDMKGVQAANQITLRFSSIHKELLQHIKEVIVAFFQVHNFGFRKSKGFGGFSVVSIDEKEYSGAIEEYEPIMDQLRESGYHGKIFGCCEEFVDWKKALKFVNALHTELKRTIRERQLPYELQGKRSPSPLQYKIISNSNGRLDLLIYVRNDENAALIDFLEEYDNLQRIAG